MLQPNIIKLDSKQAKLIVLLALKYLRQRMQMRELLGLLLEKNVKLQPGPLVISKY
jgi:hypothetical protein